MSTVSEALASFDREIERHKQAIASVQVALKALPAPIPETSHVPATVRQRWELSNALHLEDILSLLEDGRITKSKADESIRMRVAGKDPVLPKAKRWFR